MKPFLHNLSVQHTYELWIVVALPVYVNNLHTTIWLLCLND